MADATPRAPHRVRTATERVGGLAAPSDDATLADGDVAGVGWSGTEAQFVELRGSRFTGGSMAASTWHRAAWSDLELDDVDLANAHFRESGWVRVVATRCRATGLNLAGCTLSDAVFRDCRVDLANLRYAKLTRCVFDGCRLSGAELIGAELTDVRFTDCRLDEANVANARCTRVRLEQCALPGLQGVSGLAGATIDPLDLFDIAHQLAGALGIALA